MQSYPGREYRISAIVWWYPRFYLSVTKSCGVTQIRYWSVAVLREADFPGQILRTTPTVPFAAICNQSGQTPSSARIRIIARKPDLLGSPDHCPFKRAVQSVISVTGEEVPEGNELIRKRPSGATSY
jgi:hypothetical protein